jgi:hypothetical protein
MRLMSDDAKSWTANHWSLGNPAGPGQDDLPRLLRRVADALEAEGPIEVLDLVVHNEITADGDWYSVTVYYSDVAEHDQTAGDPLLP